MTDFVNIGENDSVDFDDLFSDFVPDDLFFTDGIEISSGDGKIPNCYAADNAASLSIGEIENLLLNDDFDSEFEPFAAPNTDAFVSDLLVDSPQTVDDAGPASSASVPPSTPIEYNNNPKDCSPSDLDEKDHLQTPQDKNHVHSDDAVDDNDPSVKKLKRQLRNRDAAVRSRERKKMYVRDLEMKSKYYEAECRRLEWMLQCVRAENHALQFALHTNHQAYGTSTKQESAVLLLESLLLGSLLWLMGIIGLFILPRQVLSIVEAALLENALEKEPRSLAPQKVASDVIRMSVLQSFMKSKRWRGARTKMKMFPIRFM